MSAAQTALDALTEWQISRATGNPDLEHEKATAMLKAVKQALTANTWRDIPNGWHISWFGIEDGKFTCQITRHDSDLDYRSDISFVSCREYTMQEAYNAAIDTVLNEYNKPEQPPC